jgi:hypothetical protein
MLNGGNQARLLGNAIRRRCNKAGIAMGIWMAKPVSVGSDQLTATVIFPQDQFSLQNNTYVPSDTINAIIAAASQEVLGREPQHDDLVVAVAMGHAGLAREDAFAQSSDMDTALGALKNAMALLHRNPDASASGTMSVAMKRLVLVKELIAGADSAEQAAAAMADEVGKGQLGSSQASVNAACRMHAKQASEHTRRIVAAVQPELKNIAEEVQGIGNALNDPTQREEFLCIADDLTTAQEAFAGMQRNTKTSRMAG